MRRLSFSMMGTVIGLGALAGGTTGCDQAYFSPAPTTNLALGLGALASPTPLPTQAAGPPSPSPSLPVNNPLPPLLCSAGKGPTSAIQYYPTSCLVPQKLAPGTLGVEINEGFEILPTKLVNIPADNPVTGTPAAADLYIEISTYEAPDTIVITAQGASGVATPLLNICNISTYSAPDPTDGTFRPYSDTILQFHVTVPQGTVSLTIDYTGSDTQEYVGIWGLNDFSAALANPMTNPFHGTSNANYFRPESGPLGIYNDNQDPLQAQPICPNQ